ncbi:BCCT transporter [Salipaludibacillus neizhouensis]|uniref:BCCT transporter n=1 Tax=Salipaludibacillus neizhouensis TaxID=885475 RepID=A0A3A9K0R2_9BACI|nr:BCCT family transporter [Salipaludibacillus neizhouensis]RKL66317.1 BCCT transporter [Salipaludibacillus neizhouensis]
MKQRQIEWPVFLISGGSLVLFVIASFISVEWIANFVESTFTWSATYFGAFWQVFMLLNLIVAAVMMVSKYGNVRLGEPGKPETSTFKWIAMIMTTLLGGGGVFWAAAEPMYHFLETPPMYGDIAPGQEATISPALAQSFLDWGFSGWAILGTLGVVVLMYGYSKGLPMKPRTLLYPLFGDSIMKKNSILGIIVDAFSILAVAAGTIGPIGFLGLQAAYGLESLFGISNTFLTQVVIIFSLVTIAAISALTGIHKGIEWLSRFNIILTITLMILILIIGPAGFIFDSFIGTFGLYLGDYFELSLYRGDRDWLGYWTIFFWAWFIGFGPAMALFISRISHGRTVRELFLAVIIIAPLVTNFWFTVVGGSGIFFELQNPGSVGDALYEGGMPATMIAIATQLPFGTWVASAFLFVSIVFVATTTDSMAYSISMTVTGNDTPARSIRVFWAITMGAVAAVLLFIGEGSINALQSFIVFTAVPVSLILLPTLWLAPKVVKKMAKSQGIIK